MINPFIDTKLYATVTLYPNKLDNNIYSNIKQELIRTLEKKCYKNYGYITKIYEILDYSNNYIIPEDNTSSVTFEVEFGCRLCHPLENTQIICRVNQIHEVFVNLIREPIHIIITNDIDRINKSVFVTDPVDKKIKLKTGEVVNKGMFVKATILSKSLIDKDNKIMALGRLDDIATDEEVKDFYNFEYSPSKHYVEYDKYIETKNE